LKKTEKIRCHSWTSEKNEKKMKKNEKFTDRFFRYCGVRHLGVPKGVKALNFQFCPCFADHCDPIFHLGKKIHLLSLPSHLRLYSPIFFRFFQTILRFLKICHN
jgi:hypothetical protein